MSFPMASRPALPYGYCACQGYYAVSREANFPFTMLSETKPQIAHVYPFGLFYAQYACIQKPKMLGLS